MPEKKPAKVQTAGPKVFDVTRPGKVGPSSTAKPVIVTNRPILRDPMMTGEDGTAPIVPTGGEAILPTANVKIEPTGNLDKKGTEAAPVETETSQEQQETPSPASDLKDVVDAAGAKETSAVEEPQASTFEPTPPPARHPQEDGSSSQTLSDDTAAALNRQTEASADTDKTEPEAFPADHDQNRPAAKTSPTDEAAQAAMLEAEVKRQAEIQQIIDSKQYYLPINAVKRRTNHRLLLGVLLILVLGAVWINVALDAGMITIPGVHPLTNFFAQ